MKSPLLIAVLLTAVISGVHPNPTPKSCTVSEEDLTTIRNAIQKASRASLDDVNLDEDLIAKCPLLKTITASLKSVASEIATLKDTGISEEQVDELKQSYEQQVNEIVKSRDIFEKQSGGDVMKEQGAMINRMTELQVQVAQLQQQIGEQTSRMYDDMAELIFQRLAMNSTDSIRNYTAHMMEQKLHTLMTKLETNYRIFLGALRYLDHLGDQPLIDKVFDGILKRLDEMSLETNKERENGKYVLVNLLCWTVNNRFLTEKYRKKQLELFRIALKFYPKTGNKEANEADIRGRQFCDANFPVNVITWFAVSRAAEVGA